jgi:hypothetical protein
MEIPFLRRPDGQPTAARFAFEFQISPAPQSVFLYLLGYRVHVFPLIPNNGVFRARKPSDENITPRNQTKLEEVHCKSANFGIQTRNLQM